MPAAAVSYTVFTKPWRMPLPDLGRFLAGLGFAGVELPVRPGYQVEPEAVTRGLPEATRVLGEFGLRIGSVAGPMDARTIAACAEAGVPLIRVCVEIPPGRSYLEQEGEVLRRLEALVPVLERHGVAIGLQNHCDRFVGSAAGLRRLIERFDPRWIAAVWDPAHCALAGEIPSLAVDLLWSHLRLVNLKNARWQRSSPAGALPVRYAYRWVGGSEGLCPWPDVVGELLRRGYRGDVCLTAEYSDHAAVDRLIAADLAWARTLAGRHMPS